MKKFKLLSLVAITSIALAQTGWAAGHGGGGGFHGGGGGGFHGGGFGGGGFHGGFAGSGFHGGGFHGRFVGGGFHGGRFHGGFHRRAFVGLGFGSYYDGYYPYAYNDDYYDDGGCYVVRRRVHTRYGWRVRPVQVCG